MVTPGFALLALRARAGRSVPGLPPKHERRSHRDHGATLTGMPVDFFGRVAAQDLSQAL